MDLHISYRSTNTTVLSNDAGETLYTIVSPLQFPRGTTTIYQHPHDANSNDTDEPKELARIHWHTIRSSQLVYDGQIHETNTFLKRSRLAYTRTFQAPDGKSYRWKLDLTKTYLEHDDDSGNFRTVATTQLRNYLTGKKPVLHIDESILHILDLVVVTWSYVEQRRREMIWGSRVSFGAISENHRD